MKRTANRMTKTCAAVLGGGMLLGSGNCVPDNFWIDTWAATLSTTADTVFTTFFLDPVIVAANQIDDE